MLDHLTNDDTQGIHFVLATVGQDNLLSGIETVVLAQGDGLCKFFQLGGNMFSHLGEEGLLPGVVGGQPL